MKLIERKARRGRRRIRPLAFRQSIMRLEHERFSDCVRGIVAKLAPDRAQDAVDKIALDLANVTIKKTPAKTGRARAGWLAFPQSAAGKRGGRGKLGLRWVGGQSAGRQTGLREGSHRRGGGRGGRKPFVEMTNAVPYIGALEFGSRPHDIPGAGNTRAKTLRFKGRDGTWTYRKRVRHPGTRAYRSLRHAMRHVRRHITEAFAGFHDPGGG